MRATFDFYLISCVLVYYFLLSFSRLVQQVNTTPGLFLIDSISLCEIEGMTRPRTTKKPSWTPGEILGRCSQLGNASVYPMPCGYVFFKNKFKVFGTNALRHFASVVFSINLQRRLYFYLSFFLNLIMSNLQRAKKWWARNPTPPLRKKRDRKREKKGEVIK